jgi:hypothetical protein
MVTALLWAETCSYVCIVKKRFVLSMYRQTVLNLKLGENILTRTKNINHQQMHKEFFHQL